MKGSREVFGREGYQRASIDAIAAQAQVSTRTIYKHFTDKAALFAAVVADSAAQMAQEETTLIAHHLHEVRRADQVEPALRALAADWVNTSAPSASHAALIARVGAEAAHLESDVVAAWWQAGPGHVLTALADMLRRFGQDGLLQIPDAERSAVQFSQLVAARPGPSTAPFPAGERAAWIADGVRVFVRGHRP